MLIVDAQVHIWAAGTPVPHHRQISRYSKDDLLKEMKEAGVDAALIHPPGWDPNSNELAIEAARQHPNRFAILGNFPLDRPESRALIDDWKSRPGMLGLRFALLQPHQQTWLTDGTMEWLWPAAERAGIPVALLAGNHLPAVGQIAERHPGLKLIIDHFGRVRGAKDDAAFANTPALAALAKHPNIAVKATGAPGESSEPYPYRNIHTHIPDLRRLRPSAHLLGHRHHPHAVQLPAMRDDVHRRAALAPGPRPRAGDGPGALRLDRLEAARLSRR